MSFRLSHLSRWENPGGRSHLSRRAPRAFTQVGGHSSGAVAPNFGGFSAMERWKNPSINGWLLRDGVPIYQWMVYSWFIYQKSMMDGFWITIWWMVYDGFSQNWILNGWLSISLFHGKSIYKWMMTGGSPYFGKPPDGFGWLFLTFF